MFSLSTGLLTALTVLSIIAASIAALACVLSVRAAARSEKAADDLEGKLRAVKAQRDELAAMSGRLDRLAGRVYQQSRRPPVSKSFAPEEPDGDMGPSRHQVFDSDLDPELAAELALQSAPPVDPGKRN